MGPWDAAAVRNALERCRRMRDAMNGMLRWADLPESGEQTGGFAATVDRTLSPAGGDDPPPDPKAIGWMVPDGLPDGMAETAYAVPDRDGYADTVRIVLTDREGRIRTAWTVDMSGLGIPTDRPRLLMDATLNAMTVANGTPLYLAAIDADGERTMLHAMDPWRVPADRLPRPDAAAQARPLPQPAAGPPWPDPRPAAPVAASIPLPAPGR